jgi:hypothetical protein
MRSIVFNLRPEVGHEQRQALLRPLDRLPGIHGTAALSPNTKSPVVQRMCYAYVNDDADIGDVRDQIAVLPDVESANLPTERRLAEDGGPV